MIGWDFTLNLDPISGKKINKKTITLQCFFIILVYLIDLLLSLHKCFTKKIHKQKEFKRRIFGTEKDHKSLDKVKRWEESTHNSSQQRTDQWFHVLTLNFEILQVAYFQSLIILLWKKCHFYCLISCNFSVQTLGYTQKKFKIFFSHENIKKLASKVADLWQFGFFFSAASTAKNGSRMKIHIGNVSQDTFVL